MSEWAGVVRSNWKCRRDSPVPTIITPTQAMAAVKDNFDDNFSLIYGSITVLGGIIGYLKAGSLAS